jgi:hypothetical protein
MMKSLGEWISFTPALWYTCVLRLLKCISLAVKDLPPTSLLKILIRKRRASIQLLKCRARKFALDLFWVKLSEVQPWPKNKVPMFSPQLADEASTLVKSRRPGLQWGRFIFRLN